MNLPRCPHCNRTLAPGPILTCVPCGYSVRPFIDKARPALEGEKKKDKP